ncbi:hypothetical protein AHF37_01851 [Paragonimus kellicotti]|nr:hypothetical protein AHF37_01851 [Paragonimus kellicotti]
MFFDLDFNLQQCKTFCQVIPFHSRPLPGDSATQDLTTFGFPLDDRVPPTENKRRQQQQQHDFNVQHERLVHYLDIVEVHLADHSLFLFHFIHLLFAPYSCSYGPLGSCGSVETSNKQLPAASSSFLNQRDYEQHLVSAHLLRNMSQDSSFISAQQYAPIELSEPRLSFPARWGVLQSVVNLPAVLNDPYYRQVDIFSRTWGDQFERAEVTPLSRLPAIHEKDFADYLTKLSSRASRKHLPSSPRANVLLQAVRSSAPFRSHPTHSASTTIHCVRLPNLF